MDDLLISLSLFFFWCFPASCKSSIIFYLFKKHGLDHEILKKYMLVANLSFI